VNVCVSGGDGLGHGKNGSTVSESSWWGWMAGGHQINQTNPYILCCVVKKGDVDDDPL
jgi:hypothetical protein